MIAELALAAALAGPACPGTVVAQRGRIAVVESGSRRLVCDRSTGRRVRIDARGRVLRLAARGSRAAVVTGGRGLIPVVQVAEPGRPVLRSRLPFRGRVVQLAVLPSGAAVYETDFNHIDLVDGERTRGLDELGRRLRVRGGRFSWLHLGQREDRVDAPFPATLPRGCAVPSVGEMVWRAPGVVVYDLVSGADRRGRARTIGCAGSAAPVVAGSWTEGRSRWSRFQPNGANGPFVAFLHRVVRSVVSDITDSYEVVDLRTGARTATGAISSGAQSSVSSWSDAVVSRSGALAWAVDTEGSTPEVRVADAGGTRVIDSGRDIDLESLVLDGTRLTWTRAGVAHEAELP
jgi:hypothetical protein